MSSSARIQALERFEPNVVGQCAACGAPLGGRRRVLCGNVECRRLYHQQYYLGRKLTAADTGMRDVVGMALSCGHVVPLPRRCDRRRKRTHCPVCVAAIVGASA